MRTKGIGPNNLGMSPLKVKKELNPNRDRKTENASATRDASRFESRISRTEYLDAKKNLTAAKGTDYEKKAGREVNRTGNNLRISNLGGESLANGEIKMAPVFVEKRGLAPKPKGATTLAATPKRKLRNMRPDKI
jgi:hypothetical protein